MSREFEPAFTRIVCDGCSVAVLECYEEIDIANYGWVVRSTPQHYDLCPSCRSDSPIEAVKRLTKLCDDAVQRNIRLNPVLTFKVLIGQDYE